jgi:hypothetical protein
MDIQPLSLSHQSLVKNQFSRLSLQLSEYSFANLFLFRELHHYEVLTIKEEVFIRGLTRDKTSFIMPTSHPQDIPRAVLLEVLDQAEMLFPIPDLWLPYLKAFPLHLSFKEEDSDYIFSTTKFATYSGRHLSKKRNLVKQLLSSHNILVQDIPASNLADAEIVLETWRQEHEVELQETDYLACQEAIHLFQKLNLHGHLIYVDSIPSGFLIGEWMTRECYVVHFDKAKRINGLYQYLFQELAQSLKETAAWINIEQDLGLPALRQAKQSYLPDLLLRKWRGYPSD